MDVPTSTLEALQYETSRIRNLCVLAHVDHGKTTLTDHLIASNGIVHPRLAGELRFLDSRDDEQARGITMKSSAISLAGEAPRGMELEDRRSGVSSSSSSMSAGGEGVAAAVPAAPSSSSSRPPSLRPTTTEASSSSSSPSRSSTPTPSLDQSRLLLYNLVDSPGHVDFCSEVGAAARLCDGCLVVVDAVEGVCVQTRAVLRQAHEERLGMCLVVNKVDRLVGELGLDVAAAARRLEAVVAHANLVVSGFRSEDAMSEADAVLADAEKAEAAEARAAEAAANGHDEGEGGDEDGSGKEEEDGEQDDDESERDAFDPARGNVAFASAQDGWAFSTAELAETCARRLGGIPLDSPAFKALQKASWGAWCLDAKAKRVVKANSSKSKGGKKASTQQQKTLFVQLGLEPVWRAYGAASDAASAVRYGDRDSAAAALDEARGKLGAMAKALALPPRAAAAVAAAASAGSGGGGGGGGSGSSTINADGVKSAARALLRGWAPMAPTLLHMAARHLPSPRAAAPLRVPRLLAGSAAEPEASSLLLLEEEEEQERSDRTTPPLPSLAPASEEEAAFERALLSCDASRGAPFVAYVGKMIAVPARTVPPRRSGGGGTAKSNSNNGDEDVFLAFARVFSGELRDGDPIFVLSSGYDPAKGSGGGEEKREGEEEKGDAAAAAAAAARALSSLSLSSGGGSSNEKKNHPVAAVVDGIFIMMGSALSRVSSAPAGALVALGGLSDRVSKTATLVSSLKGARPLARVRLQAAPIVRVAVEARDPARQGCVARGLRALDRADPAVTVSVLPSGEHVLGAAGEVHLETAVKDLRERYARCELVVSAPIAAFRESAADAAAERSAAVASAASAADAAAVPPLPKHAKVVEVSTPGGAVTLRARAAPLPGALAAALDALDPRSLAGMMMMMMKGEGESNSSSELLRLRSRLSTAVAKHAPTLGARCWALGPGGAGPCMLLSDDLDGEQEEEEEEEKSNGSKSKNSAFVSAISSSSSSLWSVPRDCVVLVTRDGGTFGGGMQAHEEAATAATAAAAVQQRGGEDGDGGRGGGEAAASSSDGAAAAAAAAAASAAAVEEAAASKRAYLRLGEPAVARALGWRSKKEKKEKEEASAAVTAASSSTSSAPHPPPLLLGPAAARAAEDAAAGVAAGFQMAAAAGPLCDEPVWGVAFEVSARLEGLSVPPSPSLSPPPSTSGPSSTPRLSLLDLPASAAASDVYGPLVGQVAAATRSLLRAALRACPGGARLVEPVLLCEVSAATAEALSGVYAALGRRRARVLRETAKEGGGVFSVHAHLPAQGALGLADDLRARSSGAASASLLLSHWERLPVDPFFTPKTEVEREELGEEGQGGGGGPNLARRLVDAVRERKGLPVAARVVESATKQRTRARKV